MEHSVGASKAGDLASVPSGQTETEVAAKEISKLRAEVERLTHLHQTDHSLADQWQAKNIELEQALIRWAAQLDGMEERLHMALKALKQIRDADTNIETVKRVAAKTIILIVPPMSPAEYKLYLDTVEPQNNGS